MKLKKSPAESIDPIKLSIAFTNRELCARSGTCIGACPEKAVRTTVDVKRVRPRMEKDEFIDSSKLGPRTADSNGKLRPAADVASYHGYERHDGFASEHCASGSCNRNYRG